jgi:5-carboxymethyl-2-hydroxymuconate isomerase
MPHFTVEYTDNIRAQIALPTLFKRVHTYLAGTGVFPLGGIRSRGILLSDYLVADGAADDAFVHATLKIGAGRPNAAQKETGDAVFEILQSHFAELFQQRGLALSFELSELHPVLNYKQNNIHQRLKSS